MDNIYTDREKLINGINKVCDAVKVTLGGAGANAILGESLPPYHIITNDGISIANKIHLADPVENMGANLMKEVATRANKESGDGTTTTMVLTQAILEEGLKSDASPMEIKRSLDECLPIINKALEEQKRDLHEDKIRDVALTSAEDQELAMTLETIYKEIGKNGIVELETSNTTETYYEIKEGVRLKNTGYIQSFGNIYGKEEVWKNPLILIVKQPITTNTQLEPIYQFLKGNNKTELVLFVDEIDQTALQAIAYLHVNGLFKTLVIKAPTLWKDLIYKDFAKITGANIVSPDSGISLKTVKMSDMGTCEKLVVTKNETRVIGIQDITSHIEDLKKEGTTEAELRLNWLQTKACELKLGANSESELSYKRLKAEDARNATYLALQGGVVPGGGVALFQCKKHLPDTIGGNILREALQMPMKQIGRNAGFEGGYKLGIDKGVDTRTNEIVNMWEAGIIDPLIVVKNSIKDAISVAGTALTAKVFITNNEDKRNM